MPPEPRCLSPDPAPMALARSLHAPRRRIYTTASTVTSTGLRSPSRRDAARLHPTPPPAVPQCPFPAVCGDTSHLSARCVAACAVHVHLALRRLLVLPLPAHRPHRGASRRVRRRPRVATAAHALTQAWRLGPGAWPCRPRLLPPPAARTHPGTHPAGRHVFCNFMGLPDFGGVPSHPHARLVATMFVVGLGGFIAAVSLDAVHRPALFGSLFWREEEP